MGKRGDAVGGEEDNRIEEAIAATTSLQFGFKPRGVTESQRAKLMELHKRRLQIKSELKIHKKAKGPSEKSKCKKFESADFKVGAEVDSLDPKDSGKHESSTSRLEEIAVPSVPKIRQKLYWGLDAKERWERKSNM